MKNPKVPIQRSTGERSAEPIPFKKPIPTVSGWKHYAAWGLVVVAGVLSVAALAISGYGLLMAK
jgi:hypothetical protein